MHKSFTDRDQFLNCLFRKDTFENLSSSGLHCPHLCLLIPNTSHNLDVESYVGKNSKLCGDSVEVVPDFFLARIRLAPVQILRRKDRIEKNTFYIVRAYKEEEVYKDIALATRVTVLQPGASHFPACSP